MQPRAVLRTDEQVAFGAFGSHLDGAPPRQEVNAWQQSRLAKRRQRLASLRRRSFFGLLLFLLLLLLWLCLPRLRYLFRLFCLWSCLCACVCALLSGRARRPFLLVVLILAGVAAVAIAHARQLGLAANAGESLNALTGGVLDEVQRAIQEEVMLQRHGAFRVKDQRRRPMHMLDPAAQLTGVAYRGGETNQRDAFRRVDDRLFPDGSASWVA